MAKLSKDVGVVAGVVFCIVLLAGCDNRYRDGLRNVSGRELEKEGD